MNRLLTILLALMIWGPPRLRFEQRSVEAAFSHPLNMDGAALFQVGVWLTGGIVASLLVLRRGLPFELTRGPLQGYAFFGIFAAGSALYSVDRLYTLFFASKIVIACLIATFAVRAATGDRVSQLLRVFFAPFLWQWLAIALLYFLVPDLVGVYLRSGSYRLNGGLFLDYGVSAAMSGLFFLTRALYTPGRGRRLLYWLFYMPTWYFVAISQTRTTMLGALFFAAILTLLHPKVSVRLLAVCLGVVGSALALLYGFGQPLMDFITRNEGLESLVGLTGRASAFSYLLDWWRTAPVTGYGYGMSRYLLMAFFNDSGLGIGAAHDALSRVLVELGVVGVLLLMVALLLGWREVLSLWRRSRGNPERYPQAQMILALMVWSTVSSVTSGGIADLSFPFVVAATVAQVANRSLAEIPDAKRRWWWRGTPDSRSTRNRGDDRAVTHPALHYGALEPR